MGPNNNYHHHRPQKATTTTPPPTTPSPKTSNNNNNCSSSTSGISSIMPSISSASSTSVLVCEQLPQRAPTPATPSSNAQLSTSASNAAAASASASAATNSHHNNNNNNHHHHHSHHNYTTNTTSAVDASTLVGCSSAAIRDSLAASAAAAAAASTALDRAQQSAIKRTQLIAVDYEPAPAEHYANVTETLKSKYTVLTPAPALQPSAAATAATAATNGVKMGGTGSNTSNGTSPGAASPANPNQLVTPKGLFKRENVQIGWRQPEGRTWTVGVGMANMGNTCYLNSTLQALFHVPSFANWLYSDEEHRKRCEQTNSQTECIICAMARTLQDTQKPQLQSCKPVRIYSKLRQICRSLQHGRQEDAHEFLRYLVEAMEKAFLLRFRNSKEFDQLTKETTPLNQILGGYLKSSVRCLACGHVSVTFQHFQELLLDIRKASSIDDALDTHFARERLEDMGYKCEACKKKVSATKQFSLERAPVALCIQLKRFSDHGGKLNKHVSFGERLNLSKYSARRTGSAVDPQMMYRLVSMVTHLGSSQQFGHYTAVGLAGTEAGGYYTFDDNSVRGMGVHSVLQTNAYIMFYELMDAGAMSTNGTSMQMATSTPTMTTPMRTVTPSNGNNGSGSEPKPQPQPQRSFIGPLMPDGLKNRAVLISTPFEHKTPTNGNGSATPLSSSLSSLSPPTPTTPASTTSNSNGIKRVLEISKCQPKLTPWVGSKLITNIGTNGSNNSNSDASSAKKPKLSNPFVDQQSTKPPTEQSTAATPATPATKPLPSMPNLDLCAVVDATSTSEATPPPTEPNATTPTSATTIETPTTITALPPSVGRPRSSPTTCSTANPSTTTNHPITIVAFTATSGRMSTPTTATIAAATNGHHGKAKNGIVTSPEAHAPKNTNGRYVSLVPYDDDDDDDEDDDDDDDNDGAAAAAIQRSPPIVKTKAGVFQVTSTNVDTTLPTSNGSSNGGTHASKKRTLNPFVAVKTNGNGNGHQHENHTAAASVPLVASTSTVGKLMQMSHLGFGGSSVKTWDGKASSMDQELKNDHLAEQRRRQEIDVDAEMDVGRQKKVKPPLMAGPSNPRHNSNQFTEQQNQHNSHQYHHQRRPDGQQHPSPQVHFKKQQFRGGQHHHGNNNRQHGGGGGNNNRQQHGGFGGNHQNKWRQNNGGGGGPNYNNGNGGRPR